MPSALDWPIQDVRVHPAPGSLMRAGVIAQPGRYRLSRRESEVYSVQIASQGCGRLTVYDAEGNDIFVQPSTFTGSFVLGANAQGGIMVEMEGYPSPQVTVNWREPDTKVI